MTSKRALLLATLVVAGAFASVAAADDPPTPSVPFCFPLPTPSAVPVPQPPQDWGQRFEFHEWRSDRLGGVVREQVRFSFCSSLTPGPFRVTVTESKGWDRHSRPFGVPRFVQAGRFTLRLARRYPTGVPQCREVAYSWRPKQVMLTPGSRAMDITLTYPIAAWPAGPNWPLQLADHEVTIR
jgi:hypothetical protein